MQRGIVVRTDDIIIEILWNTCKVSSSSSSSFQAALLALQEENMQASSIKHKYFVQAHSKVSPSLTAQQIHTYQKPLR